MKKQVDDVRKCVATAPNSTPRRCFNFCNFRYTVRRVIDRTAKGKKNLSKARPPPPPFPPFPHTRAQGPKIQRLVTSNRLQRKRAEKAAKVKRGEATKTATKEYVQPPAAQPSATTACFCFHSTHAAAAASHARDRYAKLKAERAKEEKAQRREKSSRRASSTGKSH